MNEQDVFDALKYRIEVDVRGTRWYYNSAGQLHRDEGPAVECTNGYKRWFTHGVEMTKAEFNQRVKDYE